MSVTSGFFNSVNSDRRYNAEQMTAIFDGIINNGVFSNVGTAFGVNADLGNTITVGIGRAWFNSKWIYNDAILPITLSDPEVFLDRIDAIIIEINNSEAVRACSIRAITGTPSSAPERPALTDSEDVHQYPLAYISRKANATEITQADITNMIGTSACPYVTGILQVVDIDQVLAQWDSEFNTWFDGIQGAFEGDPAVELANRIISLESQFITLGKEGRVFNDLEDSSGDLILDNNGRVIQGSTAFAYRGSGEPGNKISAEEMYVALNDLAIKLSEYIEANDNRIDEIVSSVEAVDNRVDNIYKIGDIVTTARTSAPDSKWRLCNGASFTRSTWPALSEYLGGSPAGPWTSNNFPSNMNIPDVVTLKRLGGYYVVLGYSRGDIQIAYASNMSGSWTVRTVVPNASTASFGTSSARLYDIVQWGNYYVILYVSQTSGIAELKIAYSSSVTSSSFTVKSVVDLTTTYSSWNENISITAASSRGIICFGVRTGSNDGFNIASYSATYPTGSFTRQLIASPYSSVPAILDGAYSGSGSTDHIFLYSLNPGSGDIFYTIGFNSSGVPQSSIRLTQFFSDNNTRYKFRLCGYYAGRHYLLVSCRRGSGTYTREIYVCNTIGIGNNWDDVLVYRDHGVSDMLNVTNMIYNDGFFSFLVGDNQEVNLFYTKTAVVISNTFSTALLATESEQVFEDSFRSEFIYNSTNYVVMVNPNNYFLCPYSTKAVLPEISPDGNAYAYIKVL